MGWNCELGPAKCYSPNPLKPIALDARSDTASVTTVPPPSGCSCQTARATCPPGLHAWAMQHRLHMCHPCRPKPLSAVSIDERAKPIWFSSRVTPLSLSPSHAACHCCSAAHFHASHCRSGCAKATSSSADRTWTSSLNLWLLLGADRKPPRATASFAESTSPWTASFGHPLTPPTPLQAPPVCCDTGRPLHHRWRALLQPLTSASSTPTVCGHGTASVVSPPLRFTCRELHTLPPHSRCDIPPLSRDGQS
jgi:hypothetical protein